MALNIEFSIQKFLHKSKFSVRIKGETNICDTMLFFSETSKKVYNICNGTVICEQSYRNPVSLLEVMR